MRSMMVLAVTLAISTVLMSSACSKQPSASYKDSVTAALEQADLKDISVSEDADRNTLTLDGKVHSDDAKARAGDVAKANAGGRVIVNQLSVEPVGMESQAKDTSSNIDDGIESNYKAALSSNGLEKQRIRFDAKNGVLTLKGNVTTTAQRKEAERLAQAVPNVQQVLNQIDVKR